MKTHLLQAAKLTAKSFFHRRSDPGIIGNRAIFRLFNTLIFLNTEEMCSKPSKTKKKIILITTQEAKKHYIFASRSKHCSSWQELISRLF